MDQPTGTVSSQRVYSGRIIAVDEDAVRYPDGSTGMLAIVRHPGASAVVPFLSDPRGANPTILLIRQYRHAANGYLLEIPAGRLDPGETPEACAHRELKEETGCTAGRIERLTTVKVVAQTGSHRHHIDFAACTEKGIIVAAASKTGVGITTAELTWALILASVRNLPHEVEQLKQGRWQTSLGTGLRSLTLGIYGLGGIGSLVAQVGKAFGMRVICWGREASHAKVVAAGYEMPATREAFFAESDIVSLHIFANEQTRGTRR